MAWTLADLAAIEKAMKSGALSVEYSDSGGRKKVEYRSLEDMQALRNEMRLELGILVPGTGQTMGVYDSGLE